MRKLGGGRMQSAPWHVLPKGERSDRSRNNRDVELNLKLSKILETLSP